MPAPDFGAIGDAIAARYSAANLAGLTPAGAQAIRGSSADLPNAVGELPYVYVSPDAGVLDPTAGGARITTFAWKVQLFYGEGGANGDLERDTGELKDWLTVLVDRHKDSMQLGGLVDACRTVGARIATLRYAGTDYTGIELAVATVNTQGWGPTA